MNATINSGVVMTEERLLKELYKVQNRMLGWMLVGLSIGFTLGWIAGWMVQGITK